MILKSYFPVVYGIPLSEINPVSELSYLIVLLYFHV
jgi:hypothetical protein